MRTQRSANDKRQSLVHKGDREAMMSVLRSGLRWIAKVLVLKGGTTYASRRVQHSPDKRQTRRHGKEKEGRGMKRATPAAKGGVKCARRNVRRKVAQKHCGQQAGRAEATCKPTAAKK